MASDFHSTLIFSILTFTLPFCSFFLIASVMLLNVVVAVLLDEFVATVTREKEEQARLEDIAGVCVCA